MKTAKQKVQGKTFMVFWTYESHTGLEEGIVRIQAKDSNQAWIKFVKQSKGDMKLKKVGNECYDKGYGFTIDHIDEMKPHK